MTWWVVISQWHSQALIGGAQRMGGSGQEGKFWLHTRQESVHGEDGEVLEKVPRGAVESSSLEIFKTWQDASLENLI